MKKLLILLLIVSCGKPQTKTVRNFGAAPDEPQALDKVRLAMSSTENLRKAANKDSDRDGIPDRVDQCDYAKETLNGYQDSDGCPDVVPTPIPPKDTVIKDTIIPPVQLPASVNLSTPPVGNQGNGFACVPFSTAYSARSIEWFYDTGVMPILSPAYVFNQTFINTCSGGTSITLALDLIKNKGVCTWATMPYVQTCSPLPNSTQDAEAATYKISGYTKLLSTDRTGIKTMLVNKHPVIVSVIVDNSFLNAGPGFIWKVKSDGQAPHAVTVVGYDDSKNAYKVMNSWGTGWGDAGFSWIDYNFFPTVVGYYVFIIN